MKRRIAKAVPNLIRHSRRRRPWSDRPKRLCLFIADPNRLGMGIADRVVVPSSQSIQPAVAHPAVTGSPLRHQESGRRIRNYIRPRPRRQNLTALVIRLDSYYVFSAISRKPAVAIVEPQNLRFSILRRSLLEPFDAARYSGSRCGSTTLGSEGACGGCTIKRLAVDSSC